MARRPEGGHGRPRRARFRAGPKLSHRVTLWAARWAAGILGCLPLGLSLAVGRLGGRVAGWVARERRALAERQLAMALGLDAKQARRTAGRMFEHLGQVAVEIAILPRLRGRLGEYVELPAADAEVLRRALAGGRGAVFVSAHVGNWEFLAQRIVQDGFPSATIVRRATNPCLNPWLEARRRADGLVTICRRDPKSARMMLKSLREGRLVGMLIDQDTRVDSVFVPFFGKLACTPTAAASLAVSRSLPVVVGFIERRSTRGHRIRIHAVDLPPERPGVDRTARVYSLTQELTRRIEEAVRRQPHEWVWVHDRWKTSPP